MWKECLLVVALIALFQLWGNINALDNGLALTPPMGFNVWPRYGCEEDCVQNPDSCISEKLIKHIADGMVSGGYKDAGYEYIIMDGCWQADERDSTGKLQPNVERFPSGFAKLSDYLHSLGLKFGISQNYGEKSCLGFPGIKNHMELDAKTFADWGIDYLKLNACGAKPDEMTFGYPEFGRLLNATGRPIVYSCTWPVYLIYENIKPDYELIQKTCNLWRGSDDCYDSFDSIRAITDHYALNQMDIQKHAGPGHWNDADTLEIGNFGLTIDHCQYQMAIWAILASPLMMSTDLDAIRPEFKEILLNKDIIAINQDPLGIQGRHMKGEEDIDIWIRQITPVVDKSYSYAVAFVNNRPFCGPDTTTIDLSTLGLNHTEGYQVKDLYDFSKSFNAIKPLEKNLFKVRVNPTGVLMLKFTPQKLDDAETQKLDDAETQKLIEQ